MNNNREDYWNKDYYNYWLKRVEESNQQAKSSELVKDDTLVSSDTNYFESIRLLEMKKSSTILEIGCGFGRSLELLSNLSKKVVAIDISEAMIKAAKMSNSKVKNIVFIVSEAENTDFRSNYFDYIVCFAVFDALDQLKALNEINRLLKLGGKVILTGKNNNYYKNDKKAITAERNARKKGHPNYFTDYKKLLQNMQNFGFKVIHNHFFVRRGYFIKQKFVKNMPNKFYEYRLVLQKTGSSNYNNKISFKYSKTYLEINGRE